MKEDWADFLDQNCNKFQNQIILRLVASAQEMAHVDE